MSPRVDPKMMRILVIMHSAVVTKALLIYGGYRLGKYLDAEWDTGSTFMFLGIVVAFVIGLSWLIFLVLRISR